MIIDAHGHYTTVPPGMRIFRALQISNMGRPSKGAVNISDDEIRSSLEKRRRMLPAGHWLIASSQSNLGAALMQLGRFGEAERELRAAYQTLLSDRGPDHEKTKLTAARLEELKSPSTRRR